MDQDDRLPRYLADNIQALRRAKGLSQDQLAKLAQIPRSTWTHIESGSGNPSLKNLAKISGALGVSVEELLTRPRSDVLHLAAKDIPIERRARGRVEIHKLLPDKVNGLGIDRFELAPGASTVGHPHVAGTKEYLMTLLGEVTVHVAGEEFCVKRGDVLAFPGDQRHSYRNVSTSSRAAAISVVIPVPADV